MTRAYSTRTLAKMLGVGQAKILSWIRSGRLAALDVGKPGKPVYRILPEAIEALLYRPDPLPLARRRIVRPVGYIERY